MAFLYVNGDGGKIVIYLYGKFLLIKKGKQKTSDTPMKIFDSQPAAIQQRALTRINRLNARLVLTIVILRNGISIL
jgi:hypothetical protein